MSAPTTVSAIVNNVIDKLSKERCVTVAVYKKMNRSFIEHLEQSNICERERDFEGEEKHHNLSINASMACRRLRQEYGYRRELFVIYVLLCRICDRHMMPRDIAQYTLKFFEQTDRWNTCPMKSICSVHYIPSLNWMITGEQFMCQGKKHCIYTPFSLVGK